MKKIFSILLSILITVSVLTAMPIISHADAGQSGDWKYWTENGELWLTGYTGDATEVEIPSELDGKKVDYLNATFAENPFVTSVVIPNTVKEIGFETFNMCESLASVTIPDSVTKIGEWAFSNCFSLETLSIPSSVEKIETGAFAYSALKSIVIPDSVKTVGSYLFHYCEDLTDVTLPNTLTSLPTYNPDGIYYGFFAHCKSLETVKLPDNLTSIDVMAFNQCLSLKSIHIPKSVTSIGWFAFADCPALESITVDSENTVFDSRDNCNAVIETATKTLAVGCKNTVVPDGVEHIGDSAFASCTTLKNISIPDGVTSIENTAFYYCTGLESIIIPTTLKTIGKQAFDNCRSLTDVYYTGTQEQSEKIEIDDFAERGLNSYFVNANMHYNYVPEITTVCEHEYVRTKLVKPTCTKGGYSIYTCSKCADTYKGTVTKATGHSWNSGVITKQPTFSKDGVKTYTCKSCKITRTETVKKLVSPSITKVKRGKKSATVTYKKAPTVAGYQLQYSTDPFFKTKCKTVTIKGANNTKKTIKKLKSNEIYRVRVRAYKTINGKKVYSKWSEKKAFRPQ